MSSGKEICADVAVCGVATFLGNLVPVLGVFVVGHPLPPATLRTLLIGWIMIAAGIAGLFWGASLTRLGLGMSARKSQYGSQTESVITAIGDRGAKGKNHAGV